MLEVLTSRTKEAPVERYAAGYEGQQYVGIDLHRRRSVVVRTTDAGELLEAVQITNSPLALAEVMTRAGNTPRSCSRRPTAGTGRPTPWPSAARPRTWRTRWG